MLNIKLSKAFNKEINNIIGDIVFSEYIKTCIDKTITKEIIKNNTKYDK